MSEKKIYKVGSRKSQLALIQTELVINELRKEIPEVDFKIVTMLTLGDKILDKPLPNIGEKSLFTRELEMALENNEVDFVVHSLKDLPTCLPQNLTIGAVLEREDPRDALILKNGLKETHVKDLPKGSVIGTSSLRRCAQILRNYPNVKVECLRGNLNTRLKKLDDTDKYSGIILAAAGIKRMKLQNRISYYFQTNELMHAVGQGALAVECNKENKQILKLLQTLNHNDTILCVIAERSFLKALGGGCSAPVAACSTLHSDKLYLKGAVWSLNGEKCIERETSAKTGSYEPPQKIAHATDEAYAGITTSVLYSDLDVAEKLGAELAYELIQLGALDIITQAKSQTNSAEI